MKNKSIIAIAAAVVLTASSALANSPEVMPTHPIVKGEDITVTTDARGNISKDEWMSYQSQVYDEMANARGSRLHEGKATWLAQQSQRFDALDADHTGMISKDEFSTTEAIMTEPAAGGPDDLSTSRPQADNQAVPTSDIPGGADGAGGWTSQ